MLRNLLDQPDPTLPFLKKQADKETWMVRELVRLNHHRNCLLCHAPSQSANDVVRGAIPFPGRRFSAYGRSSDPAVRADITYLWQDFSMLLPVPNAKPWPARQRFDFVAWTRPATPAEVAAHQTRKAETPTVRSAHQQTIYYALRELTR